MGSNQNDKLEAKKRWLFDQITETGQQPITEDFARMLQQFRREEEGFSVEGYLEVEYTQQGSWHQQI